jgi:hypothetical protein
MPASLNFSLIRSVIAFTCVVLSPEQMTKYSVIVVRLLKSRISISFAFLSRAAFAASRALSLLSKGFSPLLFLAKI